MSTFEKQWGTLHFSKSGYPAFVRLVRKEYNSYIAELRDNALKAHAKLAKLKPRERKGAFDSMVSRNTLYLNPPRESHNCLVYSNGFESSTADLDKLRDEMFRGKNGALTKPRMGSFPTLTNKQTEFSIDCDDGTFILEQCSDGSGSLHWLVLWDNHAVRDAQNTGTYSAVAAALSNHKWRRNEGGEWYYENEHSREAAEENGTESTSVSSRFGPLGEQMHHDRFNLSRGKRRRA